MTARTAIPISRPATTGGWNARDSFADMDPREATLLDNWIPTTSWLETRAGHSVAYRGGAEDGDYETLAEYDGLGTKKLIGAANNELWLLSDIPVTRIGTGYDNDRWQHVNVNNLMLMVNGADSIKFDGTTVTANSITGPTAPIGIMVHGSRVFVWDDEASSFWFGDTDQISGTFSEFDLKYVTSLGGKLVCAGSWTRDGGDEGLADLAVFVTSVGEVVIYQGTDPGDATNWQRIGVYRIAEPMSVRGIGKMGGDLVVMTRAGYMPLSQVLGTGDVSDRGALSFKIRRAVTEATASYKDNYGWSMTFHPNKNLALFNVPTGSDTAVQHVMNTESGAWCRFTGLNSVVMTVFNSDLYMGGGQVGQEWDSFYWDEEHWTSSLVFKVLDGNTDNGSPIEAEARTAYDYMGSPGQLKQPTSIRPVLNGAEGLAPLVSIATNFSERFPDAEVSFSGLASGTAWGAGAWDTFFWADEPEVNVGWFSLSGAGQAISTRIRMLTGSGSVKWYSSDYIVKGGGIV